MRLSTKLLAVASVVSTFSVALTINVTEICPKSSSLSLGDEDFGIPFEALLKGN